MRAPREDSSSSRQACDASNARSVHVVSGPVGRCSELPYGRPASNRSFVRLWKRRGEMPSPVSNTPALVTHDANSDSAEIGSSSLARHRRPDSHRRIGPPQTRAVSRLRLASSASTNVGVREREDGIDRAVHVGLGEGRHGHGSPSRISLPYDRPPTRASSSVRTPTSSASSGTPAGHRPAGARAGSSIRAGSGTRATHAPLLERRDGSARGRRSRSPGR